MDKKVYFCKVFFVEKHGCMNESVLTVDLLQGEISFIRFSERIKRKMPGGRILETYYYDGELVEIWDKDVPVRIIKNGRNNWKGIYLEADSEREMTYCKGIKLDEAQIGQLRRYCNAEEFEPYRNRNMSMEDEGFIGYRDEVTMHFYGITNDHIPFIHLPMDYYYDEEHIWPSERLYRYIHRTYHEQLNSRDNGKKSKKTGNGMLEYGAYSLFG